MGSVLCATRSGQGDIRAQRRRSVLPRTEAILVSSSMLLVVYSSTSYQRQSLSASDAFS